MHISLIYIFAIIIFSIHKTPYPPSSVRPLNTLNGARHVASSNPSNCTLKNP